jgi:hypothetical protein
MNLNDNKKLQNDRFWVKNYLHLWSVWSTIMQDNLLEIDKTKVFQLSESLDVCGNLNVDHSLGF